MTTPCEEFEIDVLRRAGHALEGQAAARLEAHLLSCASCQNFAAEFGATDDILRGRVQAASAVRDWDAVRARFRGRRRALSNRQLRGLAAFVVMVAITWSVAGPSVGLAFAGWFAGIAGYVYWRFVLPERRRVSRLEAVDTDLLAFYRASLDQEIEGLRSGRPLMVVFGLLFVMNALLMVGHVVWRVVRGEEVSPLGSHLATFGVFAVLAGFFWLRGRVLLPRVLRERRELGE